MKRLSLRSMLLVPTLVTIVTGFIVFAVAVDVSERALRLSEIDAELSRAERVPLTAFIPGRDDGQAGTVLPPASALPDAGFPDDSPIQLAVTADGTIVGGQGGATRSARQRSSVSPPVHPLGDDGRRVPRARFTVARGSGADHGSVARRL